MQIGRRDGTNSPFGSGRKRLRFVIGLTGTEAVKRQLTSHVDGQISVNKIRRKTGESPYRGRNNHLVTVDVACLRRDCRQL
jgi:hypothetical protein